MLDTPKTQGIQAEFEYWVQNIHSTLDKVLPDGESMDDLTEGGYWKTLCFAAWALNNAEYDVIDLAQRERLACLYRAHKFQDE